MQEGQQPASCDALVRQLVDQGKLTAFQAKMIRDGDGKSLVLGNYAILDELGQGGMGTVFKAEHRRMRRLVALKVLSPKVINSPELMERFQREVRAAARLEHPNIVTAYDADEAQGTPFFVMQYVDGQDLAAYIKRKGPLPVKQAVDCIVQAARGLQYAHDRGVIHRDIKPGNLLLDKEGVVKILDLGLARIDSSEAQEADLTSTSVVMGTVDYMAPEQAIATKNADALSDQYSLGLTLWYLLTGRCAYGGDSMVAKLLAHRDSPIPSLTMSRPDVPLQLDFIFQKMVAKLPCNRYPSIAEAAESLVQSLSENGLESARTAQTWNGSATQVERSGSAADEPATSASPMAQRDDFHDETLIPGATNSHASSLLTSTASESNLSNGPRRILAWSGIWGIVVAAVLAWLWINRPIQPTSGSNGSSVPSAATQTWQPTPEQQAFIDNVAKLPVNDQSRAVREKLREINPEYDGKGTERSEEGKVTVFDLPSTDISNLWPVRALPDLTTLLCRGGDGKSAKLSDLSSLAGMRLTQLSIQLTSVSDLSPLAGMPLERLECFSTPVTDLSPLAGMPLSYLNLANTSVDDLSPLRGASLNNFSCSNTRVTDLSPLTGMPLTIFSCNVSRVTDLTPLRGAPLRKLTCDDALILGHRELLRGIKTLETINGRPAKEVLAESLWRPTPEQQAFFDEVGKLWPKEQVQSVAQKLQEINPGFDGAAQFGSPDGKTVTELTLSSVEVADLWPVRALSQLHTLTCCGTQETRGKLQDISPLSGLKLKTLYIGSTEVADLSPLAGMPLNYLVCDRTEITDLSPLRGMPLTYLACGFNPEISDLSPLRGMPLTTLSCEYTNISDLDSLAGMKLRHLNVSKTKVSDLSVLAGMPLTELHFYVTRVDDLSPLTGAALTNLSANGTRIADLSVLRGMPLTQVHILATSVTDLSPLQGMPLQDFAASDNLIRAHHEFLSAIPTLETINDRPAKEVLAESLWRPAPEQQAFFDEVAKLPPNDQVQAVSKKLQEINPGFDGAVQYQSPDGKTVTTLTLSSVEVAHLWPVRALSELTYLNCSGTQETRGKLRDISPLSGMKLRTLNIGSTEVADLSPLVGMPLNYLICDRTEVADLSPLRSMPLTYLDCGFNPGVSDLSPLKGVPLSTLFCEDTNIASLVPLTGMKLTHLNVSKTRVSDLSAVTGMPLITLGCEDTSIASLVPLTGMKLTHLNVSKTKVSDLSAVAGMPLTELYCYLTTVDDLSPLKGAPLTNLSVNGTRIADLSVLRDMPLTQVHILATSVTDLSPLQGMPLQDLAASDDLIRAHHDFLSAIPTLETINKKTAAEVLAR